MDNRVELIIQALGMDATLRGLRDIQRLTRELNNKKVDIRANMNDIDRKMNDLRRKLDNLFRERRELKVGSADWKRVTAEIQSVRDQLNDLQRQRTDLRIDSSEASNANAALREMKGQAHDTANAVREIGRAFQSIGSAVKSFGSLFDTRILDTIQRYLTVMATRSFAGDWSNAFSRFDILNTYSSYLDVVGISSEQAQASLDKLNESIQGLPVGLDQVAYQTRQYQMYMNDLNRATNLAIGLNRALIAGGANEQMRTQTEYEIDRLLAAGELNTSRQWRALLQGLGVSVRFLREEMGLGDIDNRQFVDMLYTRQIATEDFLRAIERLADSEHLDSVLDIYRTTIESGMSNIRFALTRGKANILSALNESLMEGTGNDISGWMLEIRDAINEMYFSASEYLRNNPEFVAGIVNKVIDAFQRLRNFDWAGLIEKMADSLMSLADALMWLMDNTPDDLFSSLIAFGSVWAKPVGTAIYGLGSALNFLAAVISSKGLMQLPALFSSLTSAVSGFLRVNPQLMALAGGAGVAALFGGMGLVHNALDNRNRNAMTSGFNPRQYADRGEFQQAMEYYEGRVSRNRQQEGYNALYDKDLAILNLLEETIPYYDQLAEQEKLAADAARDFADAEGAVANNAGTVITALGNMQHAFLENSEAASEMIQKTLAGFDEMEKAATVGGSTILKNLRSQTDAAKDYNDNLESLLRSGLQLGGERGEGILQITADAAQQGLDGAGILRGLNESVKSAIESGNFDAVDNIIAEYGERTELSAQSVDMTAAAQTIAQNLAEAIKLHGQSPMEDAFQYLMQAMTNSLPDEPFEEDSVLFNLPWHNEELDRTIQRNTHAEETFAQTADTAKESAKGLAEDGLAPVAQKSDEAKTNVEALDGATSSMADTMDSRKSAVDSFADSINQLWSSAVATTTEINSLRNAIDAIESKDVNINLNTNRTMSYGPVGANYWASGGEVEWKAKGTDTVPAMLTPGEFVLRRSAAKALGSKVLKRLNSLDFGGAIDAMMSNFARPTSAFYNVTNTRNDNRHVSVTQNIQTSNPNYSYRIASRFAHAL